MLEVCDPDADLDVLKKLIKMNTGHTIKLTKEQTCQVYDDIKAGKLPLPPLIMNSNKTYLIDKKSPLKPTDYEVLFDSSSKRADIKKVARKVGLVQIEQMTKSQMIDSIGKRLRYMKIHEPVKIGQKRTPVVKKGEVFNNTAVMNNTAVANTNVKNNFANTNVVNTNVKNNFANTDVVNTNRKNTTVVNTNRKNTTTVVNKPTPPTTRVNFPKGGLFMKGQKPNFLNGRVSAVKKPTQSVFIKSNTFKGAKKGYVFKTGNQGTGYYMNEGPVVVQGPSLPPPPDIRSRLVMNLNALGLNSQDKTTIMEKFNKGNKNVRKLVEEAKRLKNVRNMEKLKTEKQRLNTLAKQLDVNVNLSELTTLNGVPGFEQRIRNAGAEKVKGTFAEKVQALSKVASNMNLNTNIQSNILKLKNDTELDAMKVRIIGVGKKKLSNIAQSLDVDFSRNIAKVDNVNKLKPLRNAINKANTERNAVIIAKKRQELKNYINRNTTLPQNKKNAFVRQVNLNSTNLTELRKEINTEIQSIKNTERAKNLNELEQYLQPLNINKTKFIQRFKNSNISLENIKVAINKEVAAKGNLNSKKRTLSSKIDEAKTYNITFDFNTNTSILISPEKVEELNRKVDKVIETAINKGRNTLSNKIINANVKNDFMNKVTAIKSLKNLKNVQGQIENAIISKKRAKKEEITKYMKQLGLNNQDIQMVVGRNLSLNDSRSMANDILDKKKRFELTKLLDEKMVPIIDRKQFYNKITKNSKIENIQRDVDEYLQIKSRETISNIRQVLNKYNLKNEDREAILKNWDYYPNMTVTNVKNRASKRANEFKREKETALRAYLTNDLKLAANDVETIMRNFNLNPRNMDTLREKALKLKTISGEKNRLKERIRKAREENGLNIEFTANIKSMNNVKTLNNKINQAYIGKGKKNLARRALNRNINISDELNAIKTMNNVQKLKNKLTGLINGKKKEDLRKLEEVIKNLNQENKNRFLKKFRNQNNSLGNLLTNVQVFKSNKEKQKFENQKQELYKYLNETLNLNVNDRNAIMLNFNTTRNLNATKQKANVLKKTRNTEKIAANRLKLEEILKPMNISQENKNSILRKFDQQPGNVETFEANAKSLMEEKRANERQELVRHINTLGLSGENRNRIVSVFDQSFNKTLNSAKNNASTLRQTRNQEKLENVLKGFTNISENNKTKLRSKLKSGVNLNSVILSGKRLNASAKSRKSTELTVINYVTSKNLGENGDKLIKNFKNGLITARKVREEANKKRASMNAGIVANKKARLRNFMKNTLLTNTDKIKYMERVGLDTNLSTIEKNIQSVNKKLKRKAVQMKNKSEKAAKRAAIVEENKFNAAGAFNAYLKKAKENEDNNFNAVNALERLNRNRNINFVNKSSLPAPVKERYIKQIEKPGTNLKPLRNLLESNIKLYAKRVAVSNMAKKKFGPLYRLSKWKPIIDDAKTVTALETINKNLKNRIELEGELKSSKIPSKSNLLGKVMRSDMKVKNLRRTFEKEMNNADKIFNRGPAISAINKLKKISQKSKTNYKGQINRAKSKADLENIKTRATREDNAIRASEEEAKQKVKAEAARKEAERKKAEAMKRVMNAANAYVAARKPMTVKESLTPK